MTRHIGLCCLPATGHLLPAGALGVELKSRGHRVTVFGVPDAEPLARRHDLEFQVFGDAIFPPGTAAARDRVMAGQVGVAAVMSTVRWNAQYFEAVLHDAASVISAAGVDLLVIDQGDLASHSVAHLLRLPVVTAAFALPMNDDAAHARWSPASPDATHAARENGRWRRLAAHLMRPLADQINRHRAAHHLDPVADVATLWSRLAQVAQIPADFDYPRALPDCFHYAAPVRRREVRPTPVFPRERLDGRPLVYAAFGSMVNRNIAMIEAVARACEALNVQLTISGGGAADRLPALPGDPIVMTLAPQLDVLAHAHVMVTHAGLNSTLESLAAGVPMVAVPITNDAPAIAARIVWTRTGVLVPPAECRPARMAEALGAVLRD